MANRILLHLCECERHRRRLATAEAAADRIHELIGALIECCPHEGDGDMHFYVAAEIPPCTTGDNAIVHLADALFILSEKCELAAATLMESLDT